MGPGRTMSWHEYRARLRQWLRSKTGRTRLERIEKSLEETRESLHTLRSQLFVQSISSPSEKSNSSPSEEFHLDSRDLDYIYGSEEPSFSAAILIAGKIATSLSEVRVTLYVDHEAVASQVLGSNGSFLLQHAPKQGGKYAVRVLFDSHGRTLRDIGPIGTVFEKGGDLERNEATLHRLMKTFRLPGRLGLGSTDHLLHLLMKRNRERVRDFSRMLSQIEGVLELRGTNPPSNVGPVGVSLEDLPGHRVAPLKVLLASWNVPCLRHGGGLWLTNLLKQLSKRHEITVVYCYSAHEEGWIEDVRPYAKKLIGVRKAYSPPPENEDSPILDYMYREYVPELGAAIDRELRTGDYDIVDYEYTWMLPYVSSAEVPRVLTVVEEPFTAYIANYTYDKVSDEDKIKRIDLLLRMFYLSTVALPRTFRNLIAVTAEDASLVSRFASGVTLHTNGIGIETDRFEHAPKHAPASAAHPRFVILGNFQHPPNIDAALFVCEKVFPTLKARHPHAELYVLGPYPNAALKAAGEREGIHVLGFVDDYLPYFRSATAFVAPIFTGSGMRVKILEAMASGTPVITTSLGIRGIVAEDQREYLHAETASEFVDAAEKCIDDPQAVREMAQRARRSIQKNHSSEAMAIQREGIWQATIEDYKANLARPKQTSNC